MITKKQSDTKGPLIGRLGYGAMNNLFAYGTLMCEEIFCSVTGIKCLTARAILPDFCRHPVRGEVYPGIIPEAESSVAGILYFDIPEKSWILLDRFEGELYERRSILVEREDSVTTKAFTYVIRSEYSNCLAENEWDFHHFLSSGKQVFQANYFGFSSLDPQE